MYLNILLLDLFVNYIAILGMWQKIFLTQGIIRDHNANTELGKIQPLENNFSQRSIKSPFITKHLNDQLHDRNQSSYLIFLSTLVDGKNHPR